MLLCLRQCFDLQLVLATLEIALTEILLSPILDAILADIRSQNNVVTCVLVNWNGYRNTIACLDRLKAMPFDGLDIVVVDNGSTDDSTEQIHSAHPDVKLIKTEHNLGFAAGCNRGIRYAIDCGSRYVWLLNNDTQPDPDALQHLVNVAESGNRIGAVGSVLYLTDPHKDVQCWGGGIVNCWFGYSREAKKPERAGRLDYLTAASVLVPALVFNDVGLFDERYFLYWEDADFSFRLRRRGWSLAVAAEAMVRHENGASTARDLAARDRYVTASAIRFLCTYSPVAWLSVPLYVLRRVVKRVARCQMARVTGVMKGVWDFVESASLHRAVRQN